MVSEQVPEGPPKLRLLVIQGVCPDYRVNFFNQLSVCTEFTLVCGERYFAETVSTDVDVFSESWVVSARNFFFLGRRGLIQTWSGFFSNLLFAPVVVVEFNPRVIGSWLFLFAGVLRPGLKTVVWGHLGSRGGFSGRFSARSLMLSIASGVIFYTKTQMRDFIGADSVRRRLEVGSAPNSVLLSCDINALDCEGEDFVYVGRLVAEKKPRLMLEALLEAPGSFRLHIVGDGPELEGMKELTRESQLESRVTFYGHISDAKELKSIYQKCVASVSPGYVGLSLTQSLSFGKPMVIADNEPHAPEIEAFKPGANGAYFRSDSAVDLATTFMNFVSERKVWANKSELIAEDCRDNYSIEAMANGFIDVVNRVSLGHLQER